MGKRKVVNGTVGVPKEYFLRMAKHDYTDYLKALPREFYQNSIDAGATRIDVKFNEKQRWIEVVDDGHGMPMEVLKNKLLVLGGSKKREGSTGAFGKAKELLFFSWEKYSIRTRNLSCVGSGADYSIKTLTTSVKGTKCKVFIPQTEDFMRFITSFRVVARKFQSDCKIFIDGSEVTCKLYRGKLVRSNDWADIYVDVEDRDSYYVQVRINGQWMFQRYTGTDIGQVVVEFKKSSIEMLTSNRDGIKEEYRNDYDAFLKEVIVEQKQILEPEPIIRKEVIRGNGDVKVNWRKWVERAKEAARNMTSDTRENIRALADAFDKVGSKVFREQMAAKLDTTDYIEDIQDAIVFIGYEPDFVLLYEDGDRKRVEKYMKSRKAKVLATAWTWIVKQTLIDCDWAGSILCGFDFSKTHRASFVKEEGIPCFCINPDLLCKEVKEDINPFLNRMYLRNDLKLCAAHEIAHMNNEWHDGEFVSRLEWVQTQTWKSEKTYTTIMNEALRNH
jgi:hypothetical protein